MITHHKTIWLWVNTLYPGCSPTLFLKCMVMTHTHVVYQQFVVQSLTRSQLFTWSIVFHQQFNGFNYTRNPEGLQTATETDSFLENLSSPSKANNPRGIQSKFNVCIIFRVFQQDLQLASPCITKNQHFTFLIQHQYGSAPKYRLIT